MLPNLFSIISVGFADESDGVWKQYMAFGFLCFIFLPFFVFLIRNLFHAKLTPLVSNLPCCLSSLPCS